MTRLSIPLLTLALAGAANAATSTGGGATTPAPTGSAPGVLAPSNQTSSSPTASQMTSGTGRTTAARIDATGVEIVPGGATVAGTTGSPDFVIGANGERIPVETAGTQPATPAATTTTPQLDAATRAAAARDRAKVARKHQLMHSITPRANNDRSDQMPDDPVSPALTPPAEAAKAR